jgi:membrane protein
VTAALRRLDRWQRRSVPVAFAVAVVRKFLDDRASRLAALVAYYAFFSLFPLLLVFVSVLGFVLQDDPGLQQDVLDSALARIPVLGTQLADDVEPLQGSTVALVVGVLGALWAGLGITTALGRAFEDIWDVPRLQQRGLLRSRLRGALVLLLIAVLLIGASGLAGLAAGGGIGPRAAQIAAIAGALAFNCLIFLLGFGLLTARPFRPRELAPGVLVAAVGAMLLQSLGGWYVNAAVNRASDTYGAFALVIGLLSWFYLLAHLVLLAAEINVVAARRLWPRSLAGGPLSQADRAVLRGAAEALRSDQRERIVVEFGEEPEHAEPR